MASWRCHSPKSPAICGRVGDTEPYQLPLGCQNSCERFGIQFIHNSPYLYSFDTSKGGLSINPIWTSPVLLRIITGLIEHIRTICDSTLCSRLTLLFATNQRQPDFWDLQARVDSRLFPWWEKMFTLFHVSMLGKPNWTHIINYYCTCLFVYLIVCFFTP